MGQITESEMKSLLIAVFFGIGFFWIALGLKDWFEATFGNGNNTLIVGILIVLFLIWKFKYKGHYSF